MPFDFPGRLLDALRNAEGVTVLTGAGISAESGVPTFRDALTGLWARYRPEDLATPEAFQHNPKLVWEWYEWRRELVRQAAPNPAHLALVEMERHVRHFILATQNVDGLHRKAGSRNVVELHGNLFRNKCFDHSHSLDSLPESAEKPPHCPQCGSLVRPDVVWFGEALPSAALEQAWQAAQDCDLFFLIGTSSLVYPAAGLPHLALEKGIPVVEINPQSTPFTQRAGYVLTGLAGEILPALIRTAWS